MSPSAVIYSQQTDRADAEPSPSFPEEASHTLAASPICLSGEQMPGPSARQTGRPHSASSSSGTSSSNDLDGDSCTDPSGRTIDDGELKAKVALIEVDLAITLFHICLDRWWSETVRRRRDGVASKVANARRTLSSLGLRISVLEDERCSNPRAAVRAGAKLKLAAIRERRYILELKLWLMELRLEDLSSILSEAEGNVREAQIKIQELTRLRDGLLRGD